MVRVSDREAYTILENTDHAWTIGRAITQEMLLLAGVPESVTGKVAAAGVAGALYAKYSKAVLEAAKEFEQGFTLGYDIDL